MSLGCIRLLVRQPIRRRQLPKVPLAELESVQERPPVTSNPGSPTLTTISQRLHPLQARSDAPRMPPASRLARACGPRHRPYGTRARRESATSVSAAAAAAAAPLLPVPIGSTSPRTDERCRVSRASEMVIVRAEQASRRGRAGTSGDSGRTSAKVAGERPREAGAWGEDFAGR